jgi:FkbM family methyltransferase
MTEHGSIGRQVAAGDSVGTAVRCHAELKAAFRSGKLSKPDYIRESFRWHRQLFDYVQIVAGTDVHEIRITADGVRFRLGDEDAELYCPPDEARVAPLEIMNFGAYEGPETRLLNALASQSKAMLDIGANIGVYSIRLALRFPELRVFAFEPIPTSFDYLQRNIAVNAVGERVRAFQYALSDHAGATTLYIAPHNGTNASLQNVAGASDAIELPGLMLTLDDWVRSFGVAPDLIKCDVEGAELLVFRGGLQTLRSHCPVVFSELLRKWAKGFGYHPNDMLELFRSIGYRCFAIGDGGIREIASVDDETPETNYVFVHPERHPNAIPLLVGET